VTQAHVMQPEFLASGTMSVPPCWDGGSEEGVSAEDAAMEVWSMVTDDDWGRSCLKACCLSCVTWGLPCL
jgi:hypothetical protein